MVYASCLSRARVIRVNWTLTLSSHHQHWQKMGGIKAIITAALLSSAAAHVVQKPLLDSEAHGLGGKPLVDSKELQSSIDGKTLSSRAEDLFKLAELSWQYVLISESVGPIKA